MSVSLTDRQADRSHVEDRSALTIRVSRGVGSGHTKLAAFDQALRAAGVSDFNLVRLSSIIPPGSSVDVTDGRHQLRGGYGDLLYCVYAEAYASVPAEEAWAGMTWAVHEDGSGAGLFVEHGGDSREVVERSLRRSLDSMMAHRPSGFRHSGTLLSSISCRSEPVCALVVASYRTASWSGDERR